MSYKKVFINHDYTTGEQFCQQFLLSSDFNTETLRQLTQTSSKETKDKIVTKIVNQFLKGQISAEDILLAYIKQSRTWLSFRLRLRQDYAMETPKLKAAKTLLTEFGQEDWYGPILSLDTKNKWYIRVKKIKDYIRVGSGSASKIDERDIRWTVIAEIGDDYIALFWNGFTFSSYTDEKIEQPAQFAFWHYIPQYFEELSKIFRSDWTIPNLHKLILTDMWNKYLGKDHYHWQHLRIRAEASGVALNAHSSGITDIDVKGLQALSRQLAESALTELEILDDSEKINRVEKSLLCTLIKEWGTKSYEFRLDKLVENLCLFLDESEPKLSLDKNLFKAHCYFGLKPGSSTQDSLLHLKCYSQFGGSSSVLKFLLNELRCQG